MIIKGLEEHTLYHYTSISAFRSMVERKELWLTYYKNVKDSKEIVLGLNIIQEEILKKFPEHLNHSFFEPYLNVTNLAPEQYMLCLCNFPDNDHLWQEYADHYAGIAIGFDAEYFALLTQKKTNRIVDLFPVNYDLEKFREGVRDAVNQMKLPAVNVIRWEAIKDKKDLHTHIGNYSHMSDLLIPCCADATMLKHPDYMKEKEIRLIKSKDIHIPFITKTLGGKKRAIYSFDNLLPIKKIIFGKNVFPKKRVKTIKFLEDQGYNFSV